MGTIVARMDSDGKVIESSDVRKIMASGSIKDGKMLVDPVNGYVLCAHDMVAKARAIWPDAILAGDTDNDPISFLHEECAECVDAKQ